MASLTTPTFCLLVCSQSIHLLCLTIHPLIFLYSTCLFKWCLHPLSFNCIISSSILPKFVSYKEAIHETAGYKVCLWDMAPVGYVQVCMCPPLYAGMHVPTSICRYACAHLYMQVCMCPPLYAACLVDLTWPSRCDPVVSPLWPPSTWTAPAS